MASTSPTKVSKLTPTQCGICDGYSTVKWRCVNCDKYICISCKSLHMKVRSTSNHKIVTVEKKSKRNNQTDKRQTKEADGEVLPNTRQNSDISGNDIDTVLNCENHTSIPLNWYCSICNLPVCRHCIQAEHSSHVRAEFGVVLERKRKKLEQFLQNVEEKQLPDARERRKKLKVVKVDFDSNVISLKREVWLRYDEFMQKIGKERENILQNFDEIQKKEDCKFSKACEEIDAEITELEGIMASLKEMMDSVDLKNICNRLPEIESSVNSIEKTDVPNPSKVSFKYAELTEYMVKNIFGKTDYIRDSEICKHLVEHNRKQIASPEVHVDVLSSFMSDFPFVRTICPINENEAWIGCWQHEGLALMSTEGSKLKSYSLKAMDLATTPAKALLVSTYLQCNISSIGKNGKLRELKSVLPLYPTGVCVTDTGDIILSLVDRYDLKVDKSSIRRIVKLDKEGNTLMLVERGDDDERLFTYPAKVSLNVNDDICVIDETGEYSGRLVVLYKDGDVKFQYGDYDEGTRDNCDLSCCACDSYGRIFLTDWLHHRIHILTKDGNFLGFLMTQEDGIHFPFCISVAIDGALWLGCKLSSECETGAVVRVKYKL